ncbi:MAG: hypothetical protein PV344_04370 [Anaplasma sp.]|nr:hypothetical protein [Anaplasma sp.]
MLTYIARIVRRTYFSRIVGDSRNSRKLGPHENLVVHSKSFCLHKSFCLQNILFN